MKSPLFVVPPLEVYTRGDPSGYANGHATYTSYNYLGGGIVSRVKSLHFDAALQATRHLFGRANVIDFGCADGVFLPSLSRYFPGVLAIDQDARFIQVARQLELSNVEFLCNAGMTPSQLIERTHEGHYKAAFVLETLEHVGSTADFYGSKMDFLDSVFALLDEDGIIVISVPTMVGLPFLIQRGALATLGLRREPISHSDFWRAVILRDTQRLEPGWTHQGHLGFNHLRLESHLEQRFKIVRHRSLFFSQVYVIKK